MLPRLRLSSEAPPSLVPLVQYYVAIRQFSCQNQIDRALDEKKDEKINRLRSVFLRSVVGN